MPAAGELAHQRQAHVAQADDADDGLLVLDLAQQLGNLVGHELVLLFVAATGASQQPLGEGLAEPATFAFGFYLSSRLCLQQQREFAAVRTRTRDTLARGSLKSRSAATIVLGSAGQAGKQLERERMKVPLLDLKARR